MLRPIASASTAPSPSPHPLKFISHPRLNLHKPFKFNHPANIILKKQSTPSVPTSAKFLCCCTATSHFAAHFDEPSGSDWELGDEEIDEAEDEVFPWEGAIMYRRNGAVSHLEYGTTLERLGLGKVSSALSRTRASEMGLRLVKPVTDYPDGTPVLISADVTRRKQKLRLDGIVRTVISLNCNRCCEPAAQSVYSDFTLLLCEEPIVEPETINLGTIFGEDKSESFETGEDDDALIDIDDQLYFPSEEKAIDISKNIRDIIHVEITMNAVCDPNCRGLCPRCATNLNTSKCICGEQKVEERPHGPLANLREQMQQT